MIFHVTLEQAGDGWIVAEVPSLPGCVSQGKDEKEALDSIKEDITAWLWAEDQKAISALPEKRGAAIDSGGSLVRWVGCEAYQARKQPKLLRKQAGKGLVRWGAFGYGQTRVRPSPVEPPDPMGKWGCVRLFGP